MLGIGARHGRAVPGRLAAQLHEPDGDALPGYVRRASPQHEGRRPLPLGAEHDARSSPSCVGVPVRGGRRSSAPASTTRRSSCASSATARTSTRCWTRRSQRDPELRRRVRVEMYRRLGYFPTESSEHSAEYVPWFMRDDDEIERFRIPVDEYVAAQRGEPRASTSATRGDAGAPASRSRSSAACEYALADHPLDRDRRAERVIYGNVRNDGLIDNLPAGRLRRGAVPRRPHRRAARRAVGELPPQCAALNRTFLNVCELTVRAALEGRREHVHHAAMLDPNTRRRRSRSTRSTRWSTSCSTPTGRACPRGCAV